MEQMQPDVKQDQGNSILNDCVCVNCQKFGHTTSMCPSRTIFTLIEEEYKLFKEQDFICDKVGELVDCKHLACANQGLFEEHEFFRKAREVACRFGVIGN